ncbi:uncharacterized protein LOC108201258 [Daucus carota subsp. sativus]|uniref:uncharacterized protein LOC108201258 n=1 Tax=Daucus carota subsp. sativus TaxID=79200 RepID=UPI0007EFD2D6|nr:PREDICTED: uncharacterized protein LOC108201258 [Daucus carota subsp. sativus]
MEEAGDDCNYLGLPNMMKKSKVVTLGFLKDKVKKRVQSGDGRFFSQGGREVLIKSVAQSLPTYAMSVFLLPLEITKDIERNLSRFWWNSKGDNGNVYKAKYFANISFIEAHIGDNPSYIWGSIWESKDLIAAGMRWRVGSGEKISIVGQPWLMDSHNPFITSNSKVLRKNKVCSLMVSDHRGWDEDILRDLFNEIDQ